MTFAILPVKNPQNAKQRLKGFLAVEQRETLARLLYRQTLAALQQAEGIDRVVVVTSDRGVAEHARCSGALVFEEDEQVSHSASADAACLRAMELGASTVLLVPIDIPTATPADFSQLAACGAPRAWSLCPPPMARAQMHLCARRPIASRAALVPAASVRISIRRSPRASMRTSCAFLD